MNPPGSPAPISRSTAAPRPGDAVIVLKDIRYVRIGTADLDSAVRFATRILGLELDTQDQHAAYLRSDQRDHTLVYLNAALDDHTVGFELDSLRDLDTAATELERAGFAVH